jgi:hypothetical protein
MLANVANLKKTERDRSESEQNSPNDQEDSATQDFDNEEQQLNSEKALSATAPAEQSVA